MQQSPDAASSAADMSLEQAEQLYAELLDQIARAKILVEEAREHLSGAAALDPDAA